VAKALPPVPNLDHFKKQAKDLLTRCRTRNLTALSLVKYYHPKFTTQSVDDITESSFALSDAQFVMARDYAFPSWPKLKLWVEELGHPLRMSWVEAVKTDDIVRVQRLLTEHRKFANSSHIEFDDPWRAKKFPTSTLDYAAAGPWPQTLECREWNKARKANIGILQLLIDHGAELDGDTHHGSCLCWILDPRIAKFLVDRGAKLNRWYDNGGSPLNFTCWSYDTERMLMLLTLGADPNLTDPDTLESCLHYAAGIAADECVRVLLEAGADPNWRCIGNANVSSNVVTKILSDTTLAAETPLHRAAVSGNAYCVRTLLDYGAAPSLETVNGETPLDWARRSNQSISILDLLKPGSPRVASTRKAI